MDSVVRYISTCNGCIHPVSLGSSTIVGVGVGPTHTHVTYMQSLYQLGDIIFVYITQQSLAWPIIGMLVVVRHGILKVVLVLRTGSPYC